MNKEISAIDVENISKSFISPEGEKVFALENVSFSIPKGVLTVISGENGSGKSLLMTIIAGLEKPTSGNVETSSKVGLVFQDADSQILGDTSLEDVCFGLSNIGVRRKRAQDLAFDALKKVHLEKKSHSPSHFLSGGEKRRLAIASILALGFDTIILDEPYSNLDYAGVKDVNNLILELLNAGTTIVLLTHETEKCLALASRFIVLKAGHKVFDGTPQEGLKANSATWDEWGIRNPLSSYSTFEDLVWK